MSSNKITYTMTGKFVACQSLNESIFRKVLMIFLVMYFKMICQYYFCTPFLIRISIQVLFQHHNVNILLILYPSRPM